MAYAPWLATVSPAPIPVLNFMFKKVYLELNKNAKPFYKRPYPMAEVHKKTFKEELDRLVAIGILEKTGPSEYLLPTFIIPKKDGRVW